MPAIGFGPATCSPTSTTRNSSRRWRRRPCLCGHPAGAGGHLLAHEIDKRRSNLVRAQQEYQRIAALAANYNAPRQKLDEVSAAVTAAQAELEVAEARHAEAQAGPTAEERAAADAGVTLARASLTVLQRRLTKTELRAPVDGLVRLWWPNRARRSDLASRS